MRILLWGTGSMSSALALGLNSQGFEFLLYNPTRAKAEGLKRRLKNAELWQGQSFDVVVLGFKPQKLSEVMEELTRILKPETLVLSLLAGVKLEKLQRHFGSRVIRLMPNLAIAEGRGVCLWSSPLDKKDNAFWQVSLNALGFAPSVSEPELDLYTLHAGCSPAYMYFLIHEMKELAQRAGGDPALAAKILTLSLQGALGQLTGEEDFKALITQVASKGGVTEATLSHWQESGALSQGLEAGLKRIQQLS
ncbi:MAG: NAD(P)-binding domain-containing protein [Proteobacteria bacterium]|nr:NAD(P)-binding domain-containing protein [Pseudomonadota bacterium]